MGFLDTIVSSALGQKGTRAYVPYALTSVGLAALIYGFSLSKTWADNFLIVSIVFIAGFVCAIVGDLGLNQEFSKALDYENITKTWEKQMASIHEILRKKRTIMDDIRSSTNKKGMLGKFLPIVTVRVVGFYAVSLSFAFAVNDIFAITSSNFLQLLSPNRVGFFIFFLALACASSLLINIVNDADSEQKPESNLQELEKQTITSYIMGDEQPDASKSSMILRVIVPIFAPQMLIPMRPIGNLSGFFQFENMFQILEAEVNNGTLTPVDPNDFESLKTVIASGSYSSDNSKLRTNLQDLSSIKPDEFLTTIFSGKRVKGTVSCRFISKSSKGKTQSKNCLLVVTALRACISRFKEIRYEGNRTLIREESDPRTTYFVLAIGDKSTVTDLELEFTLKAKRANPAEFSQCKES